MGWLTSLLAIIQLVPSAIQLIEKLVDAINSHPKGVEAGVAHMHAHLDSLGTVGVAPELKTV